MSDDPKDDPIYQLPLIRLLATVKTVGLTPRQFNVLALIISETFDSTKGAEHVMPKFISIKLFEKYTRYTAEVIQEILELLIENRIVLRTYPDKSGLAFYAVNLDSDTWTVWEDSPAAPLSPQEGTDG